MAKPGPTVVAEFDKGILSADDLKELRPGTIFYLTVRTVSERGRRSRTSTIRLRRLGVWSQQEIEYLAAEARSLDESLADLWD